MFMWINLGCISKSWFLFVKHDYHTIVVFNVVGMYAENLMDVSRHELAWECDYRREARCMKVFR